MITIHNRHTESVQGLWDGFWPCPVQQICNNGYIGGSNLSDPLNGWSWAGLHCAHGHLSTTKHSTHIRSSAALRIAPHDISGGYPPSSHPDGTWPGLPSRDDTTDVGIFPSWNDRRGEGAAKAETDGQQLQLLSVI